MRPEAELIHLCPLLEPCVYVEFNTVEAEAHATKLPGETPETGDAYASHIPAATAALLPPEPTPAERRSRTSQSTMLTLGGG